MPLFSTRALRVKRLSVRSRARSNSGQDWDEPLLQGTQVLALCRNATAQPLSACLESVDSVDGRKRVSEYLDAQPFPHYEQALNEPGFLVRTEADGKREVGRFVNRQFQARKVLKQQHKVLQKKRAT